MSKVTKFELIQINARLAAENEILRNQLADIVAAAPKVNPAAKTQAEIDAFFARKKAIKAARSSAAEQAKAALANAASINPAPSAPSAAPSSEIQAPSAEISARRAAMQAAKAAAIAGGVTVVI